MKKSLLAAIAFALMAAASFASAIDFGMPIARTLALSTAYQASDPYSAAVFTTSTLCENGECTIEVRMGSSSLDCTNGTVLFGRWYTYTDREIFDIKLPAGAWFIVCPIFNTSNIPFAIEQSIR